MREESFNLSFNVFIQFLKQKGGGGRKIEAFREICISFAKMNLSAVLIYTEAVLETSPFKITSDDLKLSEFLMKLIK